MTRFEEKFAEAFVGDAGGRGLAQVPPAFGDKRGVKPAAADAATSEAPLCRTDLREAAAQAPAREDPSDGECVTADKRGLATTLSSDTAAGVPNEVQGAPLSPKAPIAHGKISTYTGRFKCRCDLCREAWRTYCAEARQRRQKAGPKRHGTNTAYIDYGCRCALCKAAASEQSRNYYARNRGRILGALREKRQRSEREADRILVARSQALSATRSALTGELADLAAEQARDERRFKVWRSASLLSWDSLFRTDEYDDDGVQQSEFEDRGASFLSRYASDAWTDIVIEIVDRRREIDSWAAAA